MHKFSIDEAALQEIRRIFSYSECQDPVASIGEVSSTRFSGICISASERAEYRPEYVHEVGGIMFVLGRDGPERYRGLQLAFDGSRFLFRDSDNIAHTSLLHLPGSPGPELKLTIHAESKGERVTLRCVLKNVSATAAVVNESNLPWLSADRFSIDAVDANGTVGHCKNPPQASTRRWANILWKPKWGSSNSKAMIQSTLKNRILSENFRGISMRKSDAGRNDVSGNLSARSPDNRLEGSRG